MAEGVHRRYPVLGRERDDTGVVRTAKEVTPTMSASTPAPASRQRRRRSGLAHPDGLQRHAQRLRRVLEVVHQPSTPTRRMLEQHYLRGLGYRRLHELQPFPPKPALKAKERPVILPPGRARLATKPVSTGSAAPRETQSAASGWPEAQRPATRPPDAPTCGRWWACPAGQRWGGAADNRWTPAHPRTRMGNCGTHPVKPVAMSSRSIRRIRGSEGSTSRGGWAPLAPIPVRLFYAWNSLPPQSGSGADPWMGDHCPRQGRALAASTAR